MPADRIAVVTGASSGIGRACALGLARDGFGVVAAARRVELLEQLARDGESEGIEILPFVADVSAKESVEELFAMVAGLGRPLAVVFNNAGVFAPPTLLEDMTESQWSTVLATNLSGAFYCTQAAFKIMKGQRPMGGRIINNGSISAHVPRPNSVAYTATKHAITGLTKSTSLDGRKYNIACGQIDIGNAVSEMSTALANGSEQADGSRRNEAMMDVSHVARAVSYMASLPLDANVQFMTVMATAMPYIGRG